MTSGLRSVILSAALVISVLGAFTAVCGYFDKEIRAHLEEMPTFEQAWIGQSLLLSQGGEKRCLNYGFGKPCILYSKNLLASGACRTEWTTDTEKGNTFRIFFRPDGAEEVAIAIVSASAVPSGAEFALIDKNDLTNTIEIIPDDGDPRTDECVTSLSK